MTPGSLIRFVTTQGRRARLAGVAYRFGWWKPALWLTPARTPAERIFRAVTLKNLGDAETAARLLEGALPEVRHQPGFHRLINLALDTLIALGRYRDALGLESSLGARRDFNWVLAHANLAEAEYCRGELDRAHQRLSNPQLEAVANAAPIAKSGLALQRAWLAVIRGDAAGALGFLRPLTVNDSPPSYRAEYHFTVAAAHGLAGDFTRADSALEAAMKCTRRASSFRNALALKGSLLHRRGDLEGAERWLAQAAAHPWKGQSGGLLSEWAEILKKLGRKKDAREALRLATLQDPESAAAKKADVDLKGARLS